ncbi:MAG: hypothetical protein JWN99_552, partial [Ilumatobacteraceae bacterium]|nr:hypothetical protein [Ilumatobacteraceae bacterium]
VGITGLQLMGAQPWISSIFNGSVLVAAVVFAHLAARLAAKASRRNRSAAA